MHLVLVLVNLFSIKQLSAASQSFGETFTNKAQKIQIAQIKDSKDIESDKLFHLEAKVEKVCEKKGCWMFLTDGKERIRVTFKDYSFFVPLSLEGKTIQTEGIIKKVRRSIADQKHFLKDEGKSESEIAKVTKDLHIFEFEAYSVKTIDS